MTFISDIATAMIAAGYGTQLGQDLFAFRFPPTPLIAYLIIPRSGRPPDSVMGGDPVDHQRLQIQVRDTDLATAEANAEALRRALDDTVTTGGRTIFATSSYPVDLTDEADIGVGAYRFSIDYEILMERV